MADQECSEQAKKCKSLKDKLCADYYCDGNIKKRVFPDDQKKKDKEEDPEKYYGAACCKVANDKNATENEIATKYTKIVITAKIWPSLLSNNVITCETDKEKCKLEDLKGYILKIGAYANPEDPQKEEENKLKEQCSKVTGDYDGDDIQKKKKKNPTDSFSFPILIKVDNLLALQKTPEEIDYDNICTPVTYELVNMLVPTSKAYTTGLKDQVGKGGKITKIDTITNPNPKNQSELDCTKYFYPNWSGPNNPGALRDGVETQKEGNKVVNYTINCENPAAKNLCSVLDCVDSGEKPKDWEGNEVTDDMVTYSQFSITLVAPDGTPGSCTSPIPVGLTLSTSTDDQAPTSTTINGVLDIGTPCEGYSDNDNRPQYPNPGITNGASGRVITVVQDDGKGGKKNVPYIDKRTAVKLCRAKDPAENDVGTCAKVSDPDCACSSLSSQDYDTWSNSFSENSTKTKEGQYFGGNIGSQFCEIYVCTTCAKLETPVQRLGGFKSYKDLFCAEEFDNESFCYVCDQGKTLKITYKEFCETRVDKNLTFLGWVDTVKDKRASISMEDAIMKCSPSVVCCKPTPAKRCFYSQSKVTDKSITINIKFLASPDDTITIPFKKDNNQYNITFNFFGPNSIPKPIPQARNTLHQKIIDDPRYANLASFSIKLTDIDGCSCDGNKLKSTILDKIKDNIKNSLYEKYSEYLNICKDILEKIIVDRTIIQVSKEQLKDARKKIIFESNFISGDATVINEITNIIENGGTNTQNSEELKNLFSNYFNIDYDKLNTNLTSSLNNLELDCNTANGSISIAPYIINISHKYNSDKNEQTKCDTGYTLNKKIWDWDPVSKETSTKQKRITETHCTDYINYLKETNCCIKGPVFAEDAVVDEKTGAITPKNIPSECIVIKPLKDDDGKVTVSARDVCERQTIIGNDGQKYKAKVLKECVFASSCVCDALLAEECANYDPAADQDPLDPDDPLDPNDKKNEKEHPDPDPNTEDEKKPLPCSKITISVQGNDKMTSQNQNVQFPINTTILDSDGQEIPIEAKDPDELESILTGRSLGQISSGLTPEQYRTRVLGKIFNISVNDDTVINTTGSVPCDDKDTKKVVKDPDDPKDPEPDPKECEKLASSIRDGNILLNQINTAIKRINDEIKSIADSNKISEDKKPTMIRTRRTTLQKNLDLKTKTEEKIKELEEKLNACKQKN